MPKFDSVCNCKEAKYRHRTQTMLLGDDRCTRHDEARCIGRRDATRGDEFDIVIAGRGERMGSAKIDSWVYFGWSCSQWLCMVTARFCD